MVCHNSLKGRGEVTLQCSYRSTCQDRPCLSNPRSLVSVNILPNIQSSQDLFLTSRINIYKPEYGVDFRELQNLFIYQKKRDKN